MEYLDGLELGKVGQVQTVIGVEHVDDATTLKGRELEKVGRGILHAKEPGKLLRLHIFNIIGMCRKEGLVCARQEVEEAGWLIHVGVDAQKLREVHEENQMEIGFFTFNVFFLRVLVFIINDDNVLLHSFYTS